MKSIAVFADGTWNSPETKAATNVLRMARGVKPTARVDGSDRKQVVFYDWGVGTDRKKISGGISGDGIDKNIQDCYRFIVHNFDHPSDKIFLFGFSRGAYTVRSLGGFIRNAGILKREHANLIPTAYEMYRSRSKKDGPSSAETTAFRTRHAHADKPSIEFMGVWDTVGALGVPVPFMGTLGEEKFLFHDAMPSSIVKHARHAIAIDEFREDFLPSPWYRDEPEGNNTIRRRFNPDKPDIKQVWFAGAHADIGGGYVETGLSDIALKWMVDEAAKYGLRFETHLKTSIAPDHAGQMHNEYKGWFKVLRPGAVREMLPHARTDPKGKVRSVRVDPTDVIVHPTVKQRWQANVDGYRESPALNKLLKANGGGWAGIKLWA